MGKKSRKVALEGDDSAPVDPVYRSDSAESHPPASESLPAGAATAEPGGHDSTAAIAPTPRVSTAAGCDRVALAEGQALLGRELAAWAEKEAAVRAALVMAMSPAAEDLEADAAALAAAAPRLAASFAAIDELCDGIAGTRQRVAALREAMEAFVLGEASPLPGAGQQPAVQGSPGGAGGPRQGSQEPEEPQGPVAARALKSKASSLFGRAFGGEGAGAGGQTEGPGLLGRLKAAAAGHQHQSQVERAMKQSPAAMWGRAPLRWAVAGERPGDFVAGLEEALAPACTIGQQRRQQMA